MIMTVIFNACCWLVLAVMVYVAVVLWVVAIIIYKDLWRELVDPNPGDVLCNLSDLRSLGGFTGHPVSFSVV